MNTSKQLSRRTFLRGLGVTVALPWLEVMGPVTSWAATPTGATQTVPNRMAFLYVPNGKIMEDWTPQQVGAGYELTEIPETVRACEGQNIGTQRFNCR